jgi:hypothetical protein
MPFEFPESYTGAWVGKDEKAELIASGTAFDISAVSYDPTNKYGPRYVVSFSLDGEERLLGFGAESVESRDRTLAAMIEFFDNNPDETISAKLEQVGRSVLVSGVE